MNSSRVTTPSLFLSIFCGGEKKNTRRHLFRVKRLSLNSDAHEQKTEEEGDKQREAHGFYRRNTESVSVEVRHLKEGVHVLFGCVVLQDGVGVLPHHVVYCSYDVGHLLGGAHGAER